MKNKRLFIKFTLWFTIIVNALAAFLMLSPRLFIKAYSLNIPDENTFSLGVICAAPTMIVWTILLYWSQRKPVRRKEIILFTIPVIIGYFVLIVYAIIYGLTKIENHIHIFFIQALMITLLVWGYNVAKTMKPEDYKRLK